MEDEKFTLTDEFGIEREADIHNVITVEGQDYLLYSLDTGNDNVGICVAKIVSLENGKEDLVDIDDPIEKEKVINVINELFDSIDEE